MESPPVNPDSKTFAAYCARVNAPVVPLIFRLANDGLLAWAAFASLQRDDSMAFLLESAAAGEDGRYSYMGSTPCRVLSLRDGTLTITNKNGDVVSKSSHADPLSALQDEMDNLKSPPIGEGLPPFLGGVVGYMGYDCARYFEDIGTPRPDLLQVPDMLWMQTDWLVVFDHYRHDIYLIKSCYAQENDWMGCYARGQDEAAAMLARLSLVPPPPLQLKLQSESPHHKLNKLEIESNLTKTEFCEIVESFKSHIQAGDIFQGVPSQRLSFRRQSSVLDIYRCLRRMNPSPYMFYLKCDDFVVAGSSPELMISADNGRVQLRPIAGTRPRGETPSKDNELEKELLSDEKEIAEHLMLVDLGRNDIGRIARAGTVKVSRFCQIERYSHVMHIVSSVEGDLQNSLSSFDALRAAFPAGTLSGAPKVRAMQIINAHEPCRRNVYGGCAGFVGFDGTMMTCIAIRSLVAKDDMCYVQAGGGVVADSVPANEYQESLNKAAAVLRAAEIAAEQ